ncbi:MAG: dihydropteroate synthase [Saprospiraceae bacterium]|nr:dihydropteroate synthase [Saprospiraceae bacterium]
MIVNCKGRILDLSSPQIMGILNVTPDSFYDGGKYKDLSAAIDQVGMMIEEGAAIIDVGGMSSRPGADIISEKEELSRVIPVIFEIARQYPDSIISVDTLRSKVADRAINAGASMVNDISGGIHDPEMIDVVSEHRAPYIIMHMKGNPKTMQQEPDYGDVTLEVLSFFAERVRLMRSQGINDVIIDPGFGFGKTIEHNYKLLEQLSVFRILDAPLLCGVSRKSMIYKLLNIPPGDALNGTTAAHMIALMGGANLLRVHDVKEAAQTIRIFMQVGRKSVTD